MSKLTLRRLSIAIGLPVMVLLIVAACGGEDATPTPTATATPPPPPTSTSVPPTPTSTPVPTPVPLESYTSLSHGVTLCVPEGWVIDESDPDTLTISHPTGLARVDVTMNTFLAAPTQAQFDEFVSLGILGIQDEFEDFVEISKERTDDPPGLLVIFTFTSNGAEQGGVALYTFNNIRGARAIATTSAAFFGLFAPLFDDAVRCVEVAPNPPGPTPTPGPTPIPTPTPIVTVTPGSYTDPTDGFSLQIPSGWGRLDPGKEEATLRFISPGLVILQVLPVDVPSAISTDAYMDTLREVRYEPLPSYQLVSEDDATVGSLSGLELQFTAATGEEASMNRYLVVVLRQGSQAYVLEAIGPEGDFGSWEAGARELIDSFRP